MRILGWQVEGFGTFANYEQLDLPSGLVIVHGPNEAGKSTLLAFVRGVLFGFPDRRSNDSLYSPLRGGRHGGALFLLGNDGKYRVERIAGRRGGLRVVRPDGSEGDPSDITRLVGGADAKLFRSVFAFSLDELTAMASLSSEEVQARIFSAGVAGAGRSARKVVEELDREAEELLKPRSGAIRELIHEAEALQLKIREAAASAARYPDILVGEQREIERLEEIRRRRATTENGLRRLTALIELWPTESERQRVTRLLEGMPAVPDFPEGADERLTAAIDAAEASHSAVDDSSSTLVRLKSERNSISVDERLESIDKEANELSSELAAERDRLGQIAVMRSSERTSKVGAEKALADLGPGWDAARLLLFDASVPAAEEVRARQQDLQKARDAAVKADADSRRFDDEIAVVETGLERAGRAVDAATGEDTSAGKLDGLKILLKATADPMAALLLLAGDVLAATSETEDALAKVRHSEREVDRIEVALANTRRSFDTVRPDSSLDPIHPVIGELTRHMEVQRQRLDALTAAEHDLANQRLAVEKALTELGPNWDEGRTSRLRCDFEQVQRIREFASQIADVHAKTEDAHRGLEEVRRSLSGKQKDLERLRTKHTANEPVAAAELVRQTAALRGIRAALGDLKEVRAQQEAKGELKRAQFAAAAIPTRADTIPPWLRWVTLGVGVLAFAAMLWRLSIADISGGVILALVAAAALALHFIGRVARTQRPADQQRGVDAECALEELEKRAGAISRAIAEDAALLGLSALPTASDLENREDQRERDRDARHAWDEIASKLKESEDELESWRKSEQVRQHNYDEAMAHETRTLGTWSSWSTEVGLPSGLAPEVAIDFLQRVRAAQANLQLRITAETAAQQTRRNVEEWDRQARAVLALRSDTGQAAAVGSALLDSISVLAEKCQEDSKLRATQARLGDEIQALERELAIASGVVVERSTAALRSVEAELKRMREEWKATEATRLRQRRQLGKAATQLADAEDRWAKWQEQHGIEGALTPDGVLDFFAGVRAARTAAAALRSLQDDVEALAEKSRQWQRRAAEVVLAADVDAALDTPDKAMQSIRDLEERCRLNFEARRLATQLDLEIAKSGDALDAATRRASHAKGALDKLLSQFDASTPEEFRTKLSLFKERRGLTEKHSDLETRIVAALGRGSDSAATRLELMEGRLAEWEEARAVNADAVEKLKPEEEDAIRAHHDLVHEQTELEKTSDVASLELQRQAIESEIVGRLHRWRVLRVTRGMIQETLAEFQRNRQPQVLAAASELFRSVTEGRYQQILQSDDGDGVAIIDQRSARRYVNEMSRGTREQLYLCIRLGLAREFGRRAEPLPLVMDDVLVNFDPKRARQVAAELLAYSSDNQVLLFTCHPSTRDMLLELDATLPVIELEVAPLSAVPQRSEEPERDDRSVDEATDEELRARVVEELTNARHLGVTDLGKRLGCTADRLRPVIAALRASGDVEMTGEKRGARYALTGAAVG